MSRTAHDTGDAMRNSAFSEWIGISALFMAAYVAAGFLGLALAQQIAAAHQGLLSFEPLSTGSRFTLRLPFGRNHD